MEPLTGLVVDGSYPLDNMATEGKNLVVFDAANDRRFASLFEDNGDGTSNHMAMYYCEPGFNSDHQRAVPRRATVPQLHTTGRGCLFTRWPLLRRAGDEHVHPE